MAFAGMWDTEMVTHLSQQKVQEFDHKSDTLVDWK